MDENPAPEGALLDRLLRFIEYRPRTVFETRERMRRWGYGRSDSDDAVVYLESRGLLDDPGFACQYLEEMLRKGYGERRIREKLLSKRLDRHLVDEVLEYYPRESDIERAIAAGEARAKRFEVADQKTARRRMREYLLRRGYPPGVARDAAVQLIEVDSDFVPE